MNHMNIDKVVLRSLSQAKGRSAILIVALAVAFLMPAGLEMALRSLAATREEFTSRLQLADLEVRMLPEDVSNLPALHAVPGVQAVEARLMMPGTIIRGDGQISNALLILLAAGEPQLDRLQLTTGRMPEGSAEEVVIERSVQSYQGYSVGDTIRLRVGKREYQHQVVGVGVSPEFFIVAANPEYFLPEKGSLSVVYGRLELLSDSLGFTMVNDLLFRFSPGADPVATRDAVLKALGQRSIERVIPKEEHLSWKHVTIDIDVFTLFEPAIGLVLSLLAASLVVITFGRMVKRQHKELGALKALGYSGWQLTRSYMLAALLLAALGSLLGIAGALGFRSAFLAIYEDAHGLPYLAHETHADLLFRSSLITVAIALASAWLSTRSIRRLDAQALMRPALQNAAGSTNAESRRWLERLPLPVRLGFKNLVRSPRLTAATILGVALSISVGAAYLICLDSMEHAMKESFQAQRWTRAVSFLYPVLEDDYRQLVSDVPGAEIEEYVRTQAVLARADRSFDVSVLGLRANSSLRGLRLVAGTLPTAPDEVVLGTDLARKLPASVGTQVDLLIRNQSHRVRVVGIKRDVLLSEIVMPLSAVRKLTELEDQATGAFVSAPTQEDNAKLDVVLRSNEFVARVTRRDTLLNEFMDILQDIRKLVLLVAIVALAVGVIFVTANASMVLRERASESSTLWALGCDRRTAWRILAVELLAQALLASICAVPITYAVATLLNGIASRAWFDQETYFSPYLGVATTLAVVVLTLVSARPTFNRLWSSELLEHLRARAIQ